MKYLAIIMQSAVSGKYCCYVCLCKGKSRYNGSRHILYDLDKQGRKLKRGDFLYCFNSHREAMSRLSDKFRVYKNKNLLRRSYKIIPRNKDEIS